MRRQPKPKRGARVLTSPGLAAAVSIALILAALILSGWQPWRQTRPGEGTNNPTRREPPQSADTARVPTPDTNAPSATNDPVALVEEGTMLFFKGDHGGAIAKYAQALKLNPEDEEIHFNMARVFTVLGRTNEAIQHYTKALELLPDYVEAHNNLGNLLVGLRRHSEAVEHFSAALKANPDSSSALNNLGRCLAELGQTREAVLQFSEAVRLHPEYLEAHFNLAGAQALLGNYGDAIRHYEKVLQLEPGFAPALAGLERVKAKQAAAKPR